MSRIILCQHRPQILEKQQETGNRKHLQEVQSGWVAGDTGSPEGWVAADILVFSYFLTIKMTFKIKEKQTSNK